MITPRRLSRSYSIILSGKQCIFSSLCGCVQGSDNDEDLYGGAWCAESEEREHWFQVDAHREVEFTGVITQGRNSELQWVLLHLHIIKPCTSAAVSLKSVLSNFFCFDPSEDFVSSYFVAFSNDSRDWTLLHDGYAEWVIEPQLIMKMFS